MKGLEKYPEKVIVAWGEAISGNKEFIQILFDLKYPELGHFCYALRNNMEAQKWLLTNGFPHLTALIEGAEGNEKALSWLEKNDYVILRHIAMAIDGDKSSLNYFVDKNKIIAVLTSKMKFVKDNIEDDNQDPHKLNI